MGIFDIKSVVDKRRNSSPMRSYMWRVVLPHLNHTKQGVNHGDGTNLADTLGVNDHYEVSSRVNTISTPFASIETDKASDGNSFWYFGKSSDISTIQLNIMEMEDSLTLKYFQAWLGMMINSDGTHNTPAIYKNDVIFYRLSASGDDLIKLTYKGYFVSEISEIVNDYDNTDLVRITVNLTGDSVESEILDSANLQEKPGEREILSKTLEFGKSLPDLDSVIENALF
jgi:hypothetical protein